MNALGTQDTTATSAAAAPTGERYGPLLGERLRGVRQQQGLSLQEVEERSGGELKASVVGAYERGERAVSVTRLRTLAEFYRVPVAELLPEPPPGQRGPAPAAPEVVIDLVALEQRTELEPALTRYVRSIQARRGDYNGRVLTVRSSDIDTLAAVLDADPGVLRERLRELGLAR